MKAIEKIRISGIDERRPSASAMPTGIDVTMPVTATTSVTSRPPHSRVSTSGSPPLSSPITAITTPMPAKIARHVTSGRQPARRPPPSQNSRADTMTAVATRSAHTGRPKAWI